MKKLVVGRWFVGLRLLLAQSVVGAFAGGAATADEIKYLDWDPTTSNLVERTCSAYELVTSTTREFADGKWYVVADTVVIDNGDNITVNGSTHLILCDSASLTVKNVGGPRAAIDVSVSGSTTNALAIYGQKSGSGSLTATGGSQGAGIGGGFRGSGGTITITGGRVSATGGTSAAGIGGGNGGAGGAVTINGISPELSGIPDKSGYQEIRIIRKSSFGQSMTALIVCDDRRDFIG